LPDGATGRSRADQEVRPTSGPAARVRPRTSSTYYLDAIVSSAEADAAAWRPRHAKSSKASFSVAL